nr:reverse transcriptase domain-containing protein [Tanacetum cinerariifolium]
MDKVQTTNLWSNAHVQPPVVRIPIPEPKVAPNLNPKPLIPYPSRLNDQKLREKTNNQMLKFLQIFQRLHFDLSFANALLHIPKLESCMALANLGASINLMPLYVCKKLSLPNLTHTRMALELATRRPFLRTAHALVDVHREKLILRDGDEQLIFHADSTLKRPHKHGNESVNMINFIDITCEDRFPEVLKFKKLNHPRKFAEELDLLDPFLLGNEDENFDPEANLRKIEYLLNQDLSTKSNIEIIDPIFEKFTNKTALDYSPPPREDDDDDDDDDSKMKLLVEAHIVESNVLLTLLLTSDSTLPEESSKSSDIASLSSSPFRNKDKVFNLSILIWGGTQISNDESKVNDLKYKDLIIEEHNFLSISSNQKLMFFLELTVIETLLSFSSENEDKVFNPEILISKGIQSFTLRLSHRTYKTFKIINNHPNIFNKGLMKFFSFSIAVPGTKKFTDCLGL